MNSSMYPKLALINIRSNSKMYLPYVLTSIATVMVFYIMCFVYKSSWLDQMLGGGNMRQILFFGTIVVAIFSVIFLLYTNSFLMKRRKKEIGLYNILGMEKKHIMKVLFYEMVMTAFISIAIGILVGILLSKMILLLLIRIISWDVMFGFEISGFAVLATIILFGAIFSVSLLTNLGRIHLSQPIELLRGGQAGEREPKSKWLLVVTGVLCMGSGYYIALTTEKPLAALNMFFIAVVLVIAGTYSLFTAGSIFFLKLLRRNKSFYYQTRHFTSVSGLIYRMKQNAVGLANICVLSTIVLVMISTTTSLYIGLGDAVRTRYPRDILLQARDTDSSHIEQVKQMMSDTLAKKGVMAEALAEYKFMDFMMYKNGNNFTAAGKKNFYDSGMTYMTCIPLKEYVKLQKRPMSLEKDEVLVYANGGSLLGDSLKLGSKSFKIVERLQHLNVDSIESDSIIEGYYLIMEDEKAMEELAHSLFAKDTPKLSYLYSFDTSLKPEAEIALAAEMRKAVKKIIPGISVESAEGSKEDIIQVYGGLLFIGIFLGILFVMATVMIIYYKQISEGFDDRERFEIMRKVGMDSHEVKTTIRSQVLIVFFLPLIVAIIHIAFAFKLITKLLVVLNLTNVALFAGCTIVVVIVFAMFYVAVYSMTARIYYRIVS